MTKPAFSPEQVEIAAALVDPGCVVEGGEIAMLNPHRKDKKRGSFKINPDTGAWADFADSNPKARGNSPVTLLMFAKGIGRTEAAQLLDAQSISPAAAPAAATKPTPSWPVANTNNIPALDSPHGFRHTKTWPYKNPQGRNVMLVARFDGPEGKTIRPYRWNNGWEAGDPAGLLPLFGLDQIAALTEDPVLVVEGEKAAEAAQAIFLDHVCTTSSHGAEAAKKTDWSTMKGRAVTIWPDHDQPGQGYAQNVAKLAYEAGASSVRIVDIPSYFPQKWDLAEKPPKGANLKKLLAAAVLVPPPPRPIEMLDPSIWLTCDPPPIRWLLKSLLPQGVPAILAGKSNCGKSLAAMQMSMAVAAGRSIFGLESDGIARKVLYISMEDDQDELHRRFRRCLDLLRLSMLWNEALEARLLKNWRAVVPVWACKDLKTLVALTGHIQDFAAQLSATDEKMGLFVLDTFAALSDGEENAAEVQQKFWAACHLLVEATGATPLVIHHVRKTLGPKPPPMTERLNFENLRGSSAIVGGARAILQMEPLTASEATRLALDEDRAIAGNYVVLALTKLNGGPKGGWIALKQRAASDVGAGFFDLMEDSERICAGLRSKAAAAALSQAESILLDLSNNMPREEIAKKHWPSDKDKVQLQKLTKAISGLRTRQKWLEQGSVMLTVKGSSVLAKLRRQADTSADMAEAESKQ